MVNFIPRDYDYIVRWESDLENTKESILADCDKHYYTNKVILQKWEELAKICILVDVLFIRPMQSWKQDKKYK